MSDKTPRRRFLAVAGSTAITALAGCSGGGDGAASDGTSMDDGTTETDSMQPDTESMADGTTQAMDEGMSGPVTVTVRIENVAPPDFYGTETQTGGQIWVTPGAFAVHTADNPIYTAGESASIGLEALAEAGPPTGFQNEPGLVDELREMTDGMGVVSAGAYTPADTVADPNDPTGEVPGAPPIAPGGAFEFDVEAEPGQRLSFASMFVPSNDVFVSPTSSGIALWPAGETPVDGDVTDSVALWDAGTEPNEHPPGQGADQAPAQDAPNQGADEGGVVRPLGEVDDGHDYPAVDDVIRVTLTPGEMMSES